MSFEQRLSLTTSLPPPNLKSWLNHEASLTDKLRAQSGEARVSVLEQTWTLPNWWDKFTLNLADSLLIHRDVLMYSQENPCWFARTIIPSSTYQLHETFFKRLKEESLGVLLFQEPAIKRNLLLPYAINKQNLEYYWLPKRFREEQAEFWARLSVFTIADSAKLYLVEIFLPGLMRV
jgi:chorismate--pyruvate lyase